MHKIVRIGAIAAGVALMVGMGTMAGLAQDKEGIIKDRRATMKRQSDDLKAIAAFAKGEGDQQTAQAKIDDLLAISPKIVDFFPPGTSTAEFGDKATEAKPEIWKEWDKFKAIPATLHSAEEKLAAAIKSGDKQAVQAQIGVVGKEGCGACHNTFRIKKS